MNIKALLIVFVSSVHILLGLLSFFIGIVSSVQTLVWSAHAVSPLFCSLFVNMLLNFAAFVNTIFNLFFCLKVCSMW
jgi:hypothetical protein